MISKPRKNADCGPYRKFRSTYRIICIYSSPLLLSLSITSVHAEIYQCTTSKGRIAYQSEPCADTDKAKKLEISTEHTLVGDPTKQREIANQLEKNKDYIKRITYTPKLSSHPNKQNSAAGGYEAAVEQREKLRERRKQLEQAVIDRCNENLEVYCRKAPLEIVRTKRSDAARAMADGRPSYRHNLAVRENSAPTELERVISKLKLLEKKIDQYGKR
jgi:hypothetical protein